MWVAAPGIVLRLADHPRPHGIAFHVPKSGPQVPQSPADTLSPVEMLRVAQVQGSEDGFEGICASRYANEMDVVGHQAVPDQAEARLPAVLAEQAEVREAVAIAEEDILAVVAALRHMVRKSDSDHSGKSCHLNIVTRRAISSLKNQQTRSLAPVLSWHRFYRSKHVAWHRFSPIGFPHLIGLL